MSIKPISPNFKWLGDMLNFLSFEAIKVPGKYRDQVLAVKQTLNNDESGLVNSILDFGIQSASSVKFKVEASNKSVQDILNNWLYNINSAKRGKIPTGINALAKEYFRERWKGSSYLVLRTLWDTVDGIELPVAMWFVDGEDIIEESDKDTVRIGEEKISLRISKNKQLELPASKEELIFVQKPYSSWGQENTTPYIIQRGLYKNMLFLQLLTEKGQLIVSKALEYLMMIKKGTEVLAREGRAEFIYSEADLTKAKEDFIKFINERKDMANQGGHSTYVTNFDTDIQHLIPDYQQAIKDELYTPILKRMLAGLGMVEVIEGTTSTRKESVLNPKPFVNEVICAVEDFKQMIKDVIEVIIERNKFAHRKYFSSNVKILDIASTNIRSFLTKDMLDHLRAAYDRGQLCHEAFIEEVCGMDYSIQIEKRKAEKEDGVDELLYPHPVQNKQDLAGAGITSDNVPLDKQGPEKRNYQGRLEYEEAPYKKNLDLPDNVKNVLPPEAQSLFREVFNQSYPKGEDYARKVAWSVVKNSFKKVGDKWVKKSKGEIETDE